MIGVWIPLSQGKYAIVDAADHERVLSRGKWSAKFIGGIWYAVRVEQKHMVYLHRFILGVSGPEHTDHCDGDGLNCQRENLRKATQMQNSRNRRGNRKRLHGAKYKGVSLHTGRWKAAIGQKLGARKINRYLGHFDTQEEAARAYDAAAILLHGDFARLNFPDAATSTCGLESVSIWLGCPSCGAQPHVNEDRGGDMIMGCDSCGWSGLFSECWEESLEVASA